MLGGLGQRSRPGSPALGAVLQGADVEAAARELVAAPQNGGPASDLLVSTDGRWAPWRPSSEAGGLQRPFTVEQLALSMSSTGRRGDEALAGAKGLVRCLAAARNRTRSHRSPCGCTTSSTTPDGSGHARTPTARAGSGYTPEGADLPHR